MTIMEIDRKVTPAQIRNGEGAAIAKRLGIVLKPMMTRDGKLACACDPHTGCTCRLPTRDAAKPKYGIGHPALITAVMAMRHLNDRLEKVEAIHAARQQGMAQSSQAPQDIIANAAAKAAMLSAEIYRDKIERTVAEHHEKKAEEATPQDFGRDIHGGRINNAPQSVDMESHKHGAALDPSSGDGRQKTTQFPLGKSRISNDGAFVTPEQARKMFAERDAKRQAEQKAFLHEAATNKAFNQNQHAMIKEIQAINDKAMKERWK